MISSLVSSLSHLPLPQIPRHQSPATSIPTAALHFPSSASSLRQSDQDSPSPKASSSRLSTSSARSQHRLVSRPCRKSSQQSGQGLTQSQAIPQHRHVASNPPSCARPLLSSTENTSCGRGGDQCCHRMSIPRTRCGLPSPSRLAEP